MPILTRRPGVLCLPILVLSAQALLAQGDFNQDGVADSADLIAYQGAVAAVDPASPEAVDALDFDQDEVLGKLDLEILAGWLLGETFTLPPDLDVTNPPKGTIYTATSSMMIEGTVSQVVDLVIGDLEFPNTTGSFSRTVFFEPGLNIVEITASVPGDDSVPDARQTREVVLDLDPPVLEITAPVPNGPALAGEMVMVSGIVTDETPTEVRIVTSRANVRATPDIFGEWSTEVPVEPGLRDITVTVTDSAGLQNSIVLPVRTFLSPEQTLVSSGGALAMLPEGAIPMEDMVVRIDDVDNAELEGILGVDLLTQGPAGGFEELPEGAIIMPSAIMLEVQDGPEQGERQFMKDIEIALPNTANASNQMPLWIFQIQPDADGDGEPQLGLVSRARVSDDGQFIVPITDGDSPADEALPGFLDGANPRFDETTLGQVEAAKAVQNLKARLEGKAAFDPLAMNVGYAIPPYQAAMPSALDTMEPPPVPAALADLLPSTKRGQVAGKQALPFRLLIEDYEDRIPVGVPDLLNLLQPPGVTYFSAPTTATFSGIVPNPLQANDLIGQGNPARSSAPRIVGGVPVRGQLGPHADPDRFSVYMSFFGQEQAFDLMAAGFNGTGQVQLCFDTRGLAASNQQFSVTIHDGDGPGEFIDFTPADDWREIGINISNFDIDVTDMRRIEWRLTGPSGSPVNWNLDHVVLKSTVELSPPPTEPPPPTPTPTGTIVDPTPPPTPHPTATTEPPVTPTPSPTRSTTGGDPTPTPGPTSPPTPGPDETPTPMPTATPPMPTPPPDRPKTQVTFYCCAASAVIPYTGKTKCDDDENVDQQRLRDCIAREQAALRRCEADLKRLQDEIDRLANGGLQGHRTAFGSTVNVGGVNVPTVLGGSAFRMFPFLSPASKGLGVGRDVAVTIADGYMSVEDIAAAAQSGDRNQQTQAAVTTTARVLNNSVRFLAKDVEDGQITSQLQRRNGFKNALSATRLLTNLYKTVQAGYQMIDALYLVEPLTEQADLDRQRCNRLFHRVRDLKNCDKGSAAWIQCNTDPLEAPLPPELQKRLVELDKKRTLYKQNLETARSAANEFVAHVENYQTFLLLLADAMELSVDIEENGASMSDEELTAKMEQLAELLQFSMEALNKYYDNVDVIERTFDETTKSLDALEQAKMIAAEEAAIVASLIAMDEESDQGDPGILVNIGGQSGIAATKSGPGGNFVAYRFATVGRRDDAVTFDGGTVNLNGSLPDTLFSGQKELAFGTLAFPFTPQQTVEFDIAFDAETIGLAIGVQDTAGIPPVVELLVPAPSKGTGGGLVIPPGAPYLVRGTANDDVVTYSSRFQINGVPTVALGTTDTPNNPNPMTFETFLQAPAGDEDGGKGGIQMLTVLAEAIDSGGNIGQSGVGTVTVDPEASFAASIVPDGAITTAGGAPIQFTATITDSGDPLPSPVWFIDGVNGGNAVSGTITQTGLYTPPAESEAFVDQVDIQVLSLDQPQLVGQTTVTIVANTIPTTTVSVLNLTLPNERSGRTASEPVSVLGLFLSNEKSGRVAADPVSVLGLFISDERGGTSNSDPVSVLGLFLPTEQSGRANSEPVSVDNN
ncbi:MAG: hypothetical protein RLY93_17445 [Sumerlaeia bacterium]